MITISLLVIALIDSLNPSIILMTLFLLSTIKPLVRVGAYVSGVFFTNLMLGLIVYFGLGATFSLFIQRIWNTTAWWVYVLELVAAIVLITVAFYMRADSRPKEEKRPKNIAPTATFVLGIGATFIEFTTAAPYLAGIALLTKSDPSIEQAFFLLVLYNVIYVAIPLLLIGFYILRKQQAAAVFSVVRKQSDRWLRSILKIIFFLIGGVMFADFIGWTLGYPIF